MDILYIPQLDDVGRVGDGGGSGEAGNRVFSKLKLLDELKKKSLWVIVKTWLEEKSYYDHYLAAQVLAEGHPLFAEALAAIKEYARLADEEVEEVLSRCVAD